jgi:hypothetical protein
MLDKGIVSTLFDVGRVRGYEHFVWMPGMTFSVCGHLPNGSKALLRIY